MNRIKKQNSKNINIAFTGIISIILTGIFLAPTNASAYDLSSARSSGLIGETDSGYLAVIDPSDPSLVNFVEKINEKRKQRYQDIAKKNSVALKTVAERAGSKLIDKTSTGEYIRISGRWKQK